MLVQPLLNNENRNVQFFFHYHNLRITIMTVLFAQSYNCKYRHGIGNTEYWIQTKKQTNRRTDKLNSYIKLNS